MEIRDVLRRFEELLSLGCADDAGRYLEETAAEREGAGDGPAAISCCNELTGFWRVSALTAALEAL